jgi:hypothetical protein
MSEWISTQREVSGETAVRVSALNAPDGMIEMSMLDDRESPSTTLSLRMRPATVRNLIRSLESALSNDDDGCHHG